MLLNFSNHHSDKWSDVQKDSAINQYDSIYDVEFPAIDPAMDEAELEVLVQEYSGTIVNIISTSTGSRNAVHIMGEMTFTFRLVNELKKQGVKCLASTTKRKAGQAGKIKTTFFGFVRFREY